MLAQLVVALTTVVMVTSVEDCRKMNGVKDFSIKHVCGKTYYSFLSTSLQGITCASNTVTCKGDGSVSILANVYVNGVLNLTTAIISKDTDPGVVWRTFPDMPSLTASRQVWYSYTEDAEGHMKATYALCKDDNPLPFRKTIVANYKNADLSDEVELMKGVVTQGGGNLEYLPNTCFPVNIQTE